MKPNETQIKMMLEIERGEVELPKNNLELFELIKKVVTAYDFNKLEKPLIDKCVDQFIRISLNSLDGSNWVYISEVKNVLKKRNYFDALCKSMSNRGIKDPSVVVAAKMIEDGLLLVSGKKVAATLKAEKLIQESDDEFRNLMNKARLDGKLEL